MITGQIIGGETVILHLKEHGPKVRAALERTVHIGNALLLRHIKEDKLSGQVLHRRTGRLSRGVHSIYESSATSIEGGAGVKVSYAAAHEYGFHGVVTVREHLRRTKAGTSYGKFGEKKRAKLAQGFTIVRAHTMHMNLPERSFMRSSLRDLTRRLTDLMTGAVRRAVNPEALS